MLTNISRFTHMIDISESYIHILTSTRTCMRDNSSHLKDIRKMSLHGAVLF
jgi:hypothetical protein